MKIPKDAQRMVKLALRLGCVIERGGKHEKLRFPDGRAIGICSSPSDPHSGVNLAREIDKMLAGRPKRRTPTRSGNG